MSPSACQLKERRGQGADAAFLSRAIREAPRRESWTQKFRDFRPRVETRARSSAHRRFPCRRKSGLLDDILVCVFSPPPGDLSLSPYRWENRPSYSRIFFLDPRSAVTFSLAVPSVISLSFSPLRQSISHIGLSFLFSFDRQTGDFSSNSPSTPFTPPIFTHGHSYSRGLLYHGVSTVLSVSGTSAG